MKRLALILLALSAGGAASSPEVLTIRETTDKLCTLNGEPVSCAYLIALFNMARYRNDEGI